MKKFLLSTVAFLAAMSLNAQVVVSVNADNALGLDADNGTSLAAGTVLWEGAEGTLSVGADDTYKPQSVKADVNGTALAGGLQGANNPKDADGGTCSSTLQAPVSGAYFVFNAKQDGYLYVIHKASSNKAYTVFEEGTAIGYTFAAVADATTELGAVYQFTLEGEGEFNALTNPVEWAEREYLKAEKPDVYAAHLSVDADGKETWTAINKGGIGVIVFPVYSDCQYIFNANGSKMTLGGIAFSEADNLTIKTTDDITVYGGNGEAPTPVAYEVWTIAGVGTMMGSSWDTADTSNDLKTTDGKVYTLVKEGIVLEKGINYEYKAAKDHAWTEAYPSSNATLTVEETGTYTIIFTFNAETKELTAKAEKTGEATIGEKTYSVIGTINGNWDNDTYMDGANGLYMAMFPNVKAGIYEFKVRVDGKWDEAYPSSNYKLELEKDANVAVLFNSETKEVSVEIVKTTIGAEDNTTAYLGDHSMLIPLSELGGGCNIKFTNYSSKANNWNNWVAVITNNYTEPFAEGAIKIALRADNWENVQFSNEGVTSNFNWDTFKDDMDGSTVEMTVDRAVNGDVKIHADITTAAGTKYFEEFTKNLGTEEALYFCLSVDGSHLELLPVDDPTAIQSAKAQAKAGIRYNLAGQKVDANYKGIVIENGKKMMVK